MMEHFETGKFTAGEGLSEEKAKEATVKLLAEKREKILEEISVEMQRLLKLKGNKLKIEIYELKDLLVKAGVNENEILDFVNSYVIESSDIIDDGNNQLH